MNKSNENGKGGNNKKTINTLALASFLNDFGSDIIYPVWPLFVTSFLGANMAVLGFIDGLGDAIVSISQAVSGYLSDKIRKRKIFIWTGYLFGALSRIGYAISTLWQQLVPFRVLDRAGKIRGSPRDAIIADASTKKNRGRNFGFLRAMDNLGAVCGIIFSIIFLGLLGYRKLFLLASIPSFIAVILILATIKEKKTAKKIYTGLSIKNLGNNFKLYLLLSSFFALGSFSYSFLLIYAKQVGIKTIFIPVLYLIFTAVASLTSLPFGSLSDRIGRKAVLQMSFIFWIIVCISFVLFKNYFVIALAFVFYGLHKGSLEPVQRTLVSELSPKKYRASSLGGFQMAIGLFALPASLSAGILWDKIGVNIPFYFSIILTAISMIMLMFVREM